MPTAAGPLETEGWEGEPAARPEGWERLLARHRKGVILDGNFPPRKGKKPSVDKGTNKRDCGVGPKDANKHSILKESRNKGLYCFKT